MTIKGSRTRPEIRLNNDKIRASDVHSIEKILEGRRVIVAIKGNQIKQNTRARAAYGLSCVNKYEYIYIYSAHRVTALHPA